MQAYRENAGSSLPEEIIAGSAIARLLWLRRGTRDGWRIDDLALRLGCSPAICLRRLATLDSTLAGQSWSVERWTECDDMGERRACCSLIGPGCPRPAARTLAQLDEGGPEMISLSDLAEIERLA